jgi:hypothetical protein
LSDHRYSIAQSKKPPEPEQKQRHFFPLPSVACQERNLTPVRKVFQAIYPRGTARNLDCSANAIRKWIKPPTDEAIIDHIAKLQQIAGWTALMIKTSIGESNGAGHGKHADRVIAVQNALQAVKVSEETSRELALRCKTVYVTDADDLLQKLQILFEDPEATDAISIPSFLSQPNAQDLFALPIETYRQLLEQIRMDASVQPRRIPTEFLKRVRAMKVASRKKRAAE